VNWRDRDGLDGAGGAEDGSARLEEGIRAPADAAA
jgi:hypothetical protein